MKYRYKCTGSCEGFTIGKIYESNQYDRLTDDDGYMIFPFIPALFDDIFVRLNDEAPPTPMEIDPKIAKNPKAPLGMAKIPLGLVPPVALAHCAAAMRDGAKKYGAWNFREVDIAASVYINACKRHLDLWADGEGEAQDSGVHHLGHAMACLALIMDSEANGNLADDRAKTGKLSELFNRLAL
jgi:hypothetical protein